MGATPRVDGALPLIASTGSNGNHDVAMAKSLGVVTGRSGVLDKVLLVMEDYCSWLMTICISLQFY